jgi:hypothetical protein
MRPPAAGAARTIRSRPNVPEVANLSRLERGFLRHDLPAAAGLRGQDHDR